MPSLDRGERLVEVGQAHPGGDPLDRDPAVALAQLGEDAVLEAVERREVDMAALRLDDVVAAVAAEQLRDSKAGARADDADHAFVRKRPVGPA